jgi:hypothetical protein
VQCSHEYAIEQCNCECNCAEEHTSSLQIVLLQVLALFRAADTDGSETLDRDELAAVLRKLCAPLRCSPFRSIRWARSVRSAQATVELMHTKPHWYGEWLSYAIDRSWEFTTASGSSAFAQCIAECDLVRRSQILCTA